MIIDLETRAAAGRIRTGSGSRKIVTGYATTFNQFYKLYDEPDYVYYEQVDRHAFDKADMQDVIMLYNHNGRVAARTINDTLELSTDDTGLLVKALLDSTEVSRLTYEEIKSGLTPQMSFGFKVAKDKVTGEEEKKAGSATGRMIVYRTILEISRVYDVSSVSFPANPNTRIIADEERGLKLLMLKQSLDKQKQIEKLKQEIARILSE